MLLLSLIHILSAVMILSLSSTAFAETVNTGNALETTALDNGDGTYSIGTDTNTAAVSYTHLDVYKRQDYLLVRKEDHKDMDS